MCIRDRSVTQALLFSHGPYLTTFRLCSLWSLIALLLDDKDTISGHDFLDRFDKGTNSIVLKVSKTPEYGNVGVVIGIQNVDILHTLLFVDEFWEVLVRMFGLHLFEERGVFLLTALKSRV